MSGGERPERLAEEFREILAEEIPRLKDPRVGFVTVTRVDVSPDLRRATVFYSVYGADRDHAATRAGLRSARSHLRGVLGHQVRMKFTPDLDFEEDIGLTQVERVSELLRQIEAGGEEPGEGGSPGTTTSSSAEAGGAAGAEEGPE